MQKNNKESFRKKTPIEEKLYSIASEITTEQEWIDYISTIVNHFVRFLQN